MLPWHIEQYRQHLQTAEHVAATGSRKLSDSTIAGKIAAVSSFYQFCQRVSFQVIPNPTIGAGSRSAPTRRRSGSPRPRSTPCSPSRVATAPRTTLVMRRSHRPAGLGDVPSRHRNWSATAGPGCSAWSAGGSSDGAGPSPERDGPYLRRTCRERRGPMFKRADGSESPGEGHELHDRQHRARAASVTEHHPHSLRHTAHDAPLEARWRSWTSGADGARLGDTGRHDSRALRARNNPAAVTLGEMFDDRLPDVDEVGRHAASVAAETAQLVVKIHRLNGSPST
ncbi:hypothetical protein HBB16_04370 [Pseudonocardia sp. MCCB 268]|nr:hypothetical protein [Pseudonocardia cytotoxica]